MEGLRSFPLGSISQLYWDNADAITEPNSSRAAIGSEALTRRWSIYLRIPLGIGVHCLAFLPRKSIKTITVYHFINQEKHLEEMKFLAVTTLAGMLAAPCVADRFVSNVQIARDDIRYPGQYINNDGTTRAISTHPGCDTSGVPHLKQLCWDYGNMRGHFQYEWEPAKRCFSKTSQDGHDCGNGVYCVDIYWDEVQCSW